MSNIQNPILFSSFFNVDKKLLKKSGLIDPFLNVDTQLFIDPILLSKSGNPEIRAQAYKDFCEHFKKYIRLLDISEKENDAAWKGAKALLDLSEPPQTGLGYGGSGTSGSSRPDKIRDAIMRTSKEIITLGAKDPEMISLMGFLEDNVGPDTIGDYTSKAIMASLARITEKFCKANGVPLHVSSIAQNIPLPKYKGRSFVLIPQDIVRDLPIARDWSEVEAAAIQSSQIRKQMNSLLAGIAKPTIADKKSALKKLALNSAKDFSKFLASIKECSGYYDPTLDALGYYKLRDLIAGNISSYKVDSVPDIKTTPDALKALVIQTINHFKHHVEKGNLWEELWNGSKPKKERAAQLIYFAIADCFCRANDVDISPEANMGGGPIDFKFSKGYQARVLVELKRSNGTVKHGYEKQLEIYKDASRTNYGIFVVMDYGDLGNKLSQIRSIQNDRLKNGEFASEIVVINAKKKASASKRK